MEGVKEENERVAVSGIIGTEIVLSNVITTAEAVLYYSRERDGERVCNGIFVYSSKKSGVNK